MSYPKGIEWRTSEGPVPYAEALAWMEARAEAIRAGTAAESVWLLEHPPIYTAGTSADAAELFNPSGFAVHEAGRGGRYTYHGPGQRVAYLCLNLDKRGRDIRAFVHALEEWLINALAELDIPAHRSPGRIGIWAGAGAAEAKIAAIGVRVRRWVTLHGVSVNLDPDLSHFNGIVPCGISEHGVTSVRALGNAATMTDLDVALRTAFPEYLEQYDGLKRGA